jgi:hypothetical protein
LASTTASPIADTTAEDHPHNRYERDREVESFEGAVPAVWRYMEDLLNPVHEAPSRRCPNMTDIDLGRLVPDEPKITARPA